MDSMTSSPTVLVVGAGISGLACAHAIRSSGVAVRVVERGRAAGGRMSGRTIDGRVADLGASYFTASSGSAFADVVQDWVHRGVARPWTDTFAVADVGGIRAAKSGPLRYGSSTGLRAVVADLAAGLDVTFGNTVERVTQDDDGVDVDGETFDRVVLAMPDPQARRLLAEPLPALDGRWEPTIAVVLGFSEKIWTEDLHGVFVSDSPDVSFIADDGDRRGDHAAVLVVHTTAGLAEQHLDDPDGAIAPVVAATRRILGLSASPTSTTAHRWTFARPSDTHGAPFLVHGRVAACGDAWGEKSSVETAWTSGHGLGLALAADLATGG